MKLWSLVLMVCMAFVSLNADAAKRLGGGKSVGQQSSNVTQRDAAGPAKPPAQNAANQAPAGGAAAAAAPKKPWGAMLGGLAAGLGLAWLAHSLGLGEAFGQFIMIAMAVMLVMVVVGMIMRARHAKAQAGGAGNGMGNGAGGLALQGAGGAPVDVATARSYNPSNVGNDASARPWERNSMSFDNSRMGSDAQPGAAGGSMIGSGLRDTSTWGIPVDFDRDGFLTAAKGNFVSLQSAWDRSDIPALRAMMTDTMLAEIKTQLADRDLHREASRDGVAVPASVNITEVVMLDAQLLGIEDVGDHYMASVEFSGMIREEPSAGPNAFREVWNMSKPKTGGGWLVAGVQALQ